MVGGPGGQHPGWLIQQQSLVTDSNAWSMEGGDQGYGLSKGEAASGEPQSWTGIRVGKRRPETSGGTIRTSPFVSSRDSFHTMKMLAF